LSDDHTFFHGNGNANHHLASGICLHKGIISAVESVEFISDRMLYIILRGCWYDIFVLNVHAPMEDESDDTKDSFLEELEHVFVHFPKYHMKVLLGDLNAKVVREDIFKPTIGNESLHEISNYNGVRAVNFATSKYLIVMSTMYPCHNIHKYTWTSVGKT
jgi:exonuclease III